MKQVLLADDEEMVLRLVSRYLQYLNYDVIECSNGTQALNCMKAFPDRIGLAILDLNLPDIPGIMLAHKIKEINPDLPILLSSGESIDIDETNRNRPEKLIHALLLKPFSLQHFSEVVNSVMGSRE